MTAEEQRFLADLEVLREGAEEASQHLYAFVTIRRRARASQRVHSLLNENPTFWLTVQRAFVVSCLLALGRIFDNDARTVSHLGKLRTFVEAQRLVLFSRAALARRGRERGMDAASADRYASEAHVPTVAEFGRLRDRIRAIRKIYDNKYQKLRHLFAHVVTTEASEIAQLFARTNVRELQWLVVALLGVHDALWGLFWNGRALVFRRRRYSAQPLPGFDAEARTFHTLPPHERIVLQAERVLAQASRPAAKRSARGAARKRPPPRPSL